MNQNVKNKVAVGAVGLALAGAGFGTACFGGAGLCAKKTESPVATRAPKAIAWAPSFQQGLAKAKQTGTPMVVDFSATWCPPCRLLASKTFTDPRVISESTHWVAVHVDVDQEQALAAQYGVTELPTVAFLRPDGSVIGGTVGYIDADQMLKNMAKAKAEAGTKPTGSGATPGAAPSDGSGA